MRGALPILSVLALLATLAGCATSPVPATVYVPTPVPCPAAQEVPEAPARTLQLDASKPGEAVQQYAANRARWIGYADALSERLAACKQ